MRFATFLAFLPTIFFRIDKQTICGGFPQSTLESHCLPILTYAIEVIFVANRDKRRKLRVAYNSLFRKVFNYRMWESVTELQHALHRPTWEELVAKRRDQFLKRTSQSDIMKIFH